MKHQEIVVRFRCPVSSKIGAPESVLYEMLEDFISYNSRNLLDSQKEQFAFFTVSRPYPTTDSWYGND